MKHSVVLIAALVFGFTVASEATEKDRWSEAEKTIVRVTERDFPNIPERVRIVLRKLKCLVPQPGEKLAAQEPYMNVVSGQLARAGQVDWVILCSSGGQSSIHVVWGGVARCPTPFAREPDRDYLQESGGSRIDFAREITVVGPKQILAPYGYFRERPPRVSHDAIADAFVGKASVRHYCDSGRWKELIGAD